MTASFLSRLNDRLLVKELDADGNVKPISALDNASIRPVPVKDRTWTSFTYTIFWFSATANVSNLYAASTGMTEGLSMWEAIACSFGGYLLAGALMALNGRAGAMYRIPFPVLCRASFGTWGALWPTFNRACMSIVWNGVLSVQGAQCLYVLLYAIFPSFQRIPNHMSEDSALTSAGMLSFFVYWVFNCLFLIVPVPKMRILVYIKFVVYWISVFAMLGWTVSLARNAGGTSALTEGSSISGSVKAWTVAKFFWLGLAGCGTFISNAADFQRYARKPNDTWFGQVFSFPVSNLLIAIVGNVIAASSKGIFGEVSPPMAYNHSNMLIYFVAYLEPGHNLNMLMEGEKYTPANRAGCALIGLGLTYSTMFSAIFENSIPAGNDIAALLPKYVTVKRGFFICACLSYAICPWYLLASASVFINFMASYQIFLSAIAGILICDYCLLRRGKLDIPALFSKSSEAPYHYYHGFGLYAFLAYVISIAPNFYGFLAQMGVKAPVGILRFYYVAYPVGLLIAFGVYAVANKVSPPKGHSLFAPGWQEPKDYVEDSDMTNPSRILDGESIDGKVSHVSETEKKPISLH